jgi:hypothetical protein
MPSPSAAIEPFAFVAETDVPDLGIKVGDVVLAEPGAGHPVALWRGLPANFGRILREHEIGALRFMDDPRRLSLLAAAAGGAVVDCRRLQRARLHLVED